MFRITRYFARAIKAKKNILKEVIINKQESEEPDDVRFVHDKDRLDPQSQYIDDFLLAKMNLKVQLLPKDILGQARKVFAKYDDATLRQAGREYMRLYQIMHATEKPANLDEFKHKPFANPIDLFKINKDMMFQVKGKSFNFHLKESLGSTEQVKKDQDTKSIHDYLDTPGQDNYMKKEDEINSLIQYTQSFAVAYLARKMPETFSTAVRVLSEIKYRFPKKDIQSILDFGAGLGSGGAAFNDLFPDNKFILSIEPSESMRKLGKFINKSTKNMSWISSLSEAHQFTYHPQFDIVYVGYVIEEIPTPEERIAVLDALWDKVKPNGFLVVVEPGSPMGYRFINDTRNWLLEKDRSEANIIAPCPHQKKCPLASDKTRWCNFEQKYERYQKDILSKYPEEKMVRLGHFSYLVAKKDEILTDINRAETPADRSFFWPRIIKPPQRNKGHVWLDLCNIEGEVENRVVSKMEKKETGSYKDARKSRWGDLWPYNKRIPNRYRKETKYGPRLW